MHGILLQHPVPSHIDERRCFDAICIDKDVDGVTCHGFGRMAMGAEAYGSATPAGIMRLLEHYSIPIVGKHAVVVGRSPILGKPLAMMLLNAHATVTICHSRTQNLPALVQQAEIVVGAVGKPGVYQRCLDCGRGESSLTLATIQVVWAILNCPLWSIDVRRIRLCRVGLAQ